MSGIVLSGSAVVTADVDVRQELVQAAILAFQDRAFNEVSLETVADVAGIPLAVVRTQFAGMNDLVVAAVAVWNGRRMRPILPLAEQYGAVAFLRQIIVANQSDPALMRLLTALANLAATPNHPVAHLLQREWVQFHAHVQRTLAHDIEVGREPATMESASGAEQLIAMYEGLQLQSMVRPHMDVLASYDRAVSRLRDGWSRAYAPPTWDI